MGKKLVIGLGISGRAAAEFLLSLQHAVIGVDRNLEHLRDNSEIQRLIRLGLKTAAEYEISDICAFDQIIVSPGIPQTHPLYVTAVRAGIEIIGEIELGCREIRNKVVGITGTNGKTTVTLWVEQMLNLCHIKARALGNVGTPLTSELKNVSPEEILVLELSSYQLETLYQPILDVAVLLNITPDHLDRYASMQDYANAKWKIGVCLKKNGVLYVEQKAIDEYRPISPAFSYKSYGYPIKNSLSTDLIEVFAEGKPVFKLPASFQGRASHDLENLLAVYSICKELGVNDSLFASHIRSLKKPPHRIEWVAETAGVNFYDDSKGTNIDAVIRAVQSIPGSIILIAGGVDKGAPYTPWIEPFSEKVKSICTIGQAADKIRTQLSPYFPVYLCKSLEEAVSIAASLAQPGDTVLLSPGCASFDMFRDYAHRGKVFQDLVKSLC